MKYASEDPSRLFVGRMLRAALVALLLWSGFGTTVTAHEPVVLPIKLNDTPRVLSLITRFGHLSFSEDALDFGDVAVGTSPSKSISVTNTTDRDLTIALGAPAGITVAPATLSLVAGATSPPLVVTWAPTQAGDLDDALTIAVSHAGVVKPLDEMLPLVGLAGAPAALRFDVPTFGENDVSGTSFGMVSVEDVLDRAPTFETTITNTGGLTARGVRVVVQGPGAILDLYGVCHEGLNEAAICVSKKMGTDGNGDPIFDARADLGDLAPNASVTALWHIVPNTAGEVDKPFDVRFTTATETTERSQTFDIAGKVIAYEIPGEGFLKAGTGGGGKEGFGAAVDPLDGDELGVLRPTGFDARTVFSVGEIDTVDLRTGALTLVVPFGGPQVVRGPFSYELKAVFNSHLWNRKTLSELIQDTPQGPPRARALNAEYPNPLFNLGSGWSFHLGRLLPPYILDGIGIRPACPSNPLAFQKQVDTGKRFVYVDATGTQHEFWRELHGNDITTSSPGPYVNKEVLYARDGSYLRLILDPANANRRWVEGPSGVKRLFVRQVGARQPTLPDEWLLQSIEDPYGNKVTIQYGPATWTIRDNAGGGGSSLRTTTIQFAGWAGQTAKDPMVVTRVALPGFAGGPARTYNLTYKPGSESLSYPPRSIFHTILNSHCPNSGIDLTVRMPRLDRITLADGSAYNFGYEHPTDDRIRLKSATLPTGATIGYQYASAWDSPPDCKNTTFGTSVNGVSRRTITEAGGGVLEDRRYLRETHRTADVPNKICQAFSAGDFSSNKAPYSEQTVAVWSALETGLSTASVHHFNIYPFDDRCNWPGRAPLGTAAQCEPIGNGVNWRLKSGRTHIERNLKISHLASARDPLDDALRLSEELYECSVGLNGVTIPRTSVGGGSQVGDDVSALTQNQNCNKRQTTYAQYEVARAGHQCQQASAHCLRDSRLKASRTEYHDDANRWIKQVKDQFDGLGHYRKTTTRSTFEGVSQHGSLEQETFKNWNPGAGTLTLNDDHTIDNHINLPNRWLLNTWNYQWTTEGAEGRGGEACFDPNLGHMTHQRSWNATSVHPSTIANGTNIIANRGNQDLVTSNEVNTATGELDVQRYFGANTYAVSTANNWCSANVWTDSNQDYAVEHAYQHGVLAQKWVSDDSVFDVRRTIDRNTGWPRTETANSGEVVTLDYDSMGRVTWASSHVTASHHVDYHQLASGRWELTAKAYPKGTFPSTSAPTPIRIYDATYDGLGRLSTEIFPLYNDNPNNPSNRKTVTRTVTYHPSGSVHRVTPLDGPAPPTTITYDYRARPLKVTNPDGSKAARQYSGIRKTVLVSCVKTGVGSTSGICKSSGFETADTVLQRDWKGRTIKVTAPLDGSAGIGAFETTFEYDPLDKRTRAKRTHNGQGPQTTQVRSWTYNGLGFLTNENIPERTATTFGDFTTRGAARTIQESGRTKNLTFDRVGRLRRIAVGSRALKRFVYCDPEAATSHPTLCSTTGPSNGKLISATRNNYRLPADSGFGVLATWLVDSTFGYDAAGRQTTRSTGVNWGSGWSSNPPLGAPVTTRFDQSWSHDDLGNLTSLGYPTCNTTSSDCNLGRTVGYTYRQGHFLTKVNAGTLGADLTYHKSGLVHQVQHQDGAGTDIYGVTGGMPRIASIDLGVGTPQRFNLGGVTYDFAGNITSIGGDTFLYDKNSRLGQASVQGTQRNYAYDNFDNLRNDGTGTPEDTGTVNPSNNQLTGGGWTYDAYGNLKTGAGITLIYDELDKLVGLHKGSGESQLGIYDHSDLRILTWSENDPTNPEKTWTLRNGLTVIREFVGLGSQILLRKDYIHAGSRLIASNTLPDNDERHYHEDQVGNARLVTGVGAGRVHYEPFGEAIGGTASGERAVGFQGHENDGLTTYMRGRTYLPLSHRFLQVDPGRDASAWSQYAFAANNPIGAVDPTGEVVETAWDIANIGFGVASFISNVREGNVGSAALDAAGVVLDTAAAVLPGVPGGAGTGIKVLRAADTATDVSRGVNRTADGAQAVGRVTDAKQVARSRSTQEMATDVGSTIPGNRVSAQSAGGRVDIDLQGKAHFDKASGKKIDTPHVHEAKLNTGPNGQSSLGNKTTREATKQDVRLARRILDRRKEQ